MKKYRITSAFILCFSSVFAQVYFTGNQSNQLPQQLLNNNDTNLSNLNNKFEPINQNDNPPIQKKQIQMMQQQAQIPIQVSDANQNIEPTLENGFHIRFQAASSLNQNTAKSSHTSFRKSKKTISEKGFTRRNRIKNRLPKRRMKYNTSLCYNF